MKKKAIIGEALDKYTELQNEHPMATMGVSLAGSLVPGFNTAMELPNIAQELRHNRPFSALGRTGAAALGVIPGLHPAMQIAGSIGSSMGGEALQQKADAAKLAADGGNDMDFQQEKKAFAAALAMPAIKALGGAALSGAASTGGAMLAQKGLDKINKPASAAPPPEPKTVSASYKRAGTFDDASPFQLSGAPKPEPGALEQLAGAKQQELPMGDSLGNSRLGLAKDKLTGLGSSIKDELSRFSHGSYDSPGMAMGGEMGSGAAAGVGLGGLGALGGGLIGGKHGAGIGGGAGLGAGIGAGLGSAGGIGLAALLGKPELSRALSMGGGGVGGLAGAVGGGALGHHMTKADHEKASSLLRRHYMNSQSVGLSSLFHQKRASSPMLLSNLMQALQGAGENAYKRVLPASFPQRAR